MSESDTSATDPLPEAFQESEESEELEKYLETENEELEEKISKKEIAEAKDSIMAFAEELFEMVNNKFIGISPMTLVSTADRLLKIQTYLTKNSK
jgi:methionyl-tRNA synthetase